jgi:hypothetical protein
MRELRPAHFEDLAKSADIIAVAKVTRVVEIDGNRVGEAVVLVPVVGVKEGQHLTIAGYKTWMCDATGIVQGECALFFLNRKDNRPQLWPALQHSLAFERRRKQVFGETSLVFIATSGQGTLPVDQLGTIFLVPVVKEFARDNRPGNQVRYQCGLLTLPRELPFFALTAAFTGRNTPFPLIERTGGMIPLENLTKKILALRHTLLDNR